jgi:hypothetical protein
MIFLEQSVIDKQYAVLIDRIQSCFPTRYPVICKMYMEMEDAIKYAPASSMEHLHNAYPGGYVDHILRVLDFSFVVYETWSRLGLNISTFTPEELAFVALHHDLGKIGFPYENGGRYVMNESEWHVKNQGKVYKINGEIPFTLVQHQSLYLLQHYEIKMSHNEFLSVMIHDGLYDETNRPYFLSHGSDSKLKTNLPYIVHQADLMAAQYEYARWIKYKSEGIWE